MKRCSLEENLQRTALRFRLFDSLFLLSKQITSDSRKRRRGVSAPATARNYANENRMQACQIATIRSETFHWHAVVEILSWPECRPATNRGRLLTSPGRNNHKNRKGFSKAMLFPADQCHLAHFSSGLADIICLYIAISFSSSCSHDNDLESIRQLTRRDSSCSRSVLFTA